MSDDCSTCLACSKPVPDDAPWYPDVSGILCAECAPTFADLLDDDETNGVVVLDDGSPMPAAERRALYDEHIAAGGKPDDSMASLAHDI